MTQDLATETDAINRSRALEIAENNVQTLNDQIVENESHIAANDEAIALMREQIHARQADSRRRRRENAILRRQRTIFSRAAYNFKELRQP